MERKKYQHTQWKLNGYCPECNKSYPVIKSPNIKEIQQSKTYYDRMLQLDKPVAKCQDCGAFFDLFIIKADLNLPEQSVSTRK
jgi:ssDNA-binding Zn-finger/Zn-ribbon topoisomerase 1